MRPAQRRRLVLGVIALGVIALGTALRLVPLGLPAGFVKYGGSVLWGAMVYALAGSVVPHARASRVAGAALLVAALVEAFRLVHAPALDAFRLTLPGQLLLGRIFSFRNVLAYAVGIALAAGLDRMGRTR